MQICFVMLIFLLFSDQISGGGELPQGGGKKASICLQMTPENYKDR